MQEEATYLARVMPPPEAVLVPMLEDVSRADARSREVASQRIVLKSGSPFGWRLAYDPALLEGPNHALRAYIKVAGQLWMTTDTRYSTFGPGAQAQPELMLHMVSNLIPNTPPRLISGSLNRVFGVEWSFNRPKH